jgi:hypothetical protein
MQPTTSVFAELSQSPVSITSAGRRSVSSAKLRRRRDQPNRLRSRPGLTIAAGAVTTTPPTRRATTYLTDNDAG